MEGDKEGETEDLKEEEVTERGRGIRDEGHTE